MKFYDFKEFNKLTNFSFIIYYKRGLSIRPFCNNIPNVGTASSKYECNLNRDAVLLCNLMRYHHPIPAMYRVNKAK
jgi:hypothetical protein